jgi:formylglycine-generating enzyme required for sulfatase activity
MLPTLGQWYYGGCATDTNGGKAANSHYPSPIVMTAAPNTSSYDDTKLNLIAWYYFNSAGSAGSRHVHEVGKKAPNQVGLYDISGNLWEWCLDWYQYDYTGGQDGVSAASSPFSYRVYRGGYWNGNPYYCSLGCHGGTNPGDYIDAFGFRAAVVP